MTDEKFFKMIQKNAEAHEVLEVFPFGAKFSHNGKPTLIG